PATRTRVGCCRQRRKPYRTSAMLITRPPRETSRSSTDRTDGRLRRSFAYRPDPPCTRLDSTTFPDETSESFAGFRNFRSCSEPKESDMTTISRGASALVFTAVFLGGVPAARAQSPDLPPDDCTASLALPEEDPDIKATGADKDDPTTRLLWQRKAWGVVTPTFRVNALKEGKGHSNKKNAPGPKWVSIGPFDGDYEQNGSFTGHVRDTGRARTILPHPTDPDIVYFLSSGGGL